MASSKCDTTSDPWPSLLPHSVLCVWKTTGIFVSFFIIRPEILLSQSCTQTTSKWYFSFFYQAVDEFSRAENIVNKNVIEEFYVSAPFL